MTRRARRLIWRTAASTLAAAVLLAAALGAMVLRQGWYDVGAIVQHWPPTHKLLELARRYSVRHHARDITAPALTPQMAQQGAAVYGRFCVQCHGAPGMAPDLATLALQPSPGPLVSMSRRWQSNELYWLISNGVKMTGMPAWRFRLSEQELWNVVAFVEALPKLTPEQGTAALAASGQDLVGLAVQQAPAQQKPDAARGKVALTQYACHSCHVIAGIPGASVDVGPPLTGMAQQRYIAGYLPNTEANLAHWIRFPTEVKPGTAMPSLQVSERDARDMAHWLLSSEAR
jgi:mono/diheme cytochrome c family protein